MATETMVDYKLQLDAETYLKQLQLAEKEAIKFINLSESLQKSTILPEKAVKSLQEYTKVIYNVKVNLDMLKTAAVDDFEAINPKALSESLKVLKTYTTAVGTLNKTYRETTKLKEEDTLRTSKKIQAENMYLRLLKDITTTKEKLSKIQEKSRLNYSTKEGRQLASYKGQLTKINNEAIKLSKIIKNLGVSSDPILFDKFKNSLNNLSNSFKKTSLHSTEFINKLNSVKGVDFSSTIDKIYNSLHKTNMAFIKIDNSLLNFDRRIKERNNYAPTKAVKNAKEYLSLLNKIKNKEDVSFSGKLKEEEKTLLRLQSAIRGVTLARRDAIDATKELKNLSEKEKVNESELSKAKTKADNATRNLNNSLRIESEALASVNQRMAYHKDQLAKLSSIKWFKNIAQRAMAYYGLYQAMQQVITATKASISYLIEYDKAIHVMAALTKFGKTTAEAFADATDEEKKLVDLTYKIGGTLEDINKVALDLIRAGVGLKEVVKGTEVVGKLAILTGDSINESVDSMITYLHVFGKGADATNRFGLSVEELGGKLAYMANVSKMTTQDIGTYSNYALAAAKAAGFSIDAINAMGAALTNTGNTASTAGTSVRKFAMSLTSSNKNIESFYEKIGVSQKQLAHDIAQGGSESNKALADFLVKLKSFSDEDFSKAVGGLGVRLQASLKQLRMSSKGIIDIMNGSIKNSAEALEAVNLATASASTVWQEFRNALLYGTADALSTPFNVITDKVRELIPYLHKTSKIISGILTSLTVGGITFITVQGLTALKEAYTWLKKIQVVEDMIVAIANKSSLGLVIGSIATLGTLAYNSYNKIQEQNKKLIDSWKKQDSTTFTNLEEDLKEAKEVLKKYQHALANASSESDALFALKGIEKYSKKVKELTYKVEEFNAKTAVINITKHSSILKAMLKDTDVSKFITKLNEYKSILQNMGATTTKPLKDAIKVVTDTFKENITATEAYVNKLSKVSPEIKNTLNNVFSGLKNAKSMKDITGLKAIVDNLNMKGLSESSKDAVNKTKELVNGLLKEKKALNEIGATIEANKDKIAKANAKEILDAYKTVITYFKQSLVNAQGNVKEQEKLVNLMKDVLPFIKDKNEHLKLSQLILSTENKIHKDNLDSIKEEEKTYQNIFKILENKFKLSEAMKDTIEQRKLTLSNLSVVNKELLKTQYAYEKSERELNHLKKNKVKIEEHLQQLQKEQLQYSSKDKEYKELQKEINKENINLSNTDLKIQQKTTEVIKNNYNYSQAYFKANGKMSQGIFKAYDDYVKRMPTKYEQGIDMMKSITSTLDDAWTNFFDKQSDAFMDFGKLGKSIINDIEKQIVKTQIVAPLTKASSDIIGSVTGSLIDSIFSGWADGGYTYRDSSDKTPVGVVHANEYVIPANMVRNHPSLVAGLEAERRGLKRFDVGGFGGGMDGYGGDSFGGGYGMSRDDGVDGFGFGGSDYGNGTTINSINTQNFVTNITTPSTVGKTKISSGIVPADITVVNLDPNAKQEFTHFNPDGTPANDNGHHIHINIGKIGGKVVGFVIGGATTKSTAGATAGAVIGGKIGEHLSPNIDISFGSTSLAEALGAKGSSSTSMSSHISNTSDTLTSLFGDDLSGDGGDFYEKYTGQTIQQAIDDINKQIINANKADIIKTTKDIWQSMIGVIPDVKTDAKEDWTTLFKNYIKEGNKALLKVTLDGTLFNTPDFYSTWEKYAKNLNEDVQKALSDKIGDLTNNQRGFKEWLYNYNDDDLGGLKYKADYLADDLAKLEKSFNVTGLSIDNFYKKQQESISKNFTPEEIDKWKQLGDALMSATDAADALRNATLKQFDSEAKYKEYMASLDKQIKKSVADYKVAILQTFHSFKIEIQDFIDSWHSSGYSNSSTYAFYAQRYNTLKGQLTNAISGNDMAKAKEVWNSLTNAANNLKNSAIASGNPNLLSNINKTVESDMQNFYGMFDTNEKAMKVIIVGDDTNISKDSTIGKLKDVINKYTEAINAQFGVSDKLKLTDFFTDPSLMQKGDIKAFANILKPKTLEELNKWINIIGNYRWNGKDYLKNLSTKDLFKAGGILNKLGLETKDIKNYINNVKAHIKTLHYANDTSPKYDGYHTISTNNKPVMFSLGSKWLHTNNGSGDAVDWAKYNKLSFLRMAEGGIVTKPTLGLIGEAGYPEAVIPMKNGRDIPIKIDNSGMEQKLNDLVILTEQQANEIRKMRKEIQERSAA